MAQAGITLTWRAVTHQGLMRQNNEDSFCVEVDNKVSPASRFLFVVADGLGGHGGGDVASKMALNTVRDEFIGWNGSPAERLLDRALRNANQAVFGEAQVHHEYSKMQTTLTAVVVEQGSLTVGHVGDCRLYRARDGLIDIMTKDHSMANELLKMHMISLEQAESHPGRHQLVRSVGGEPFLRTDVFRENVISGDMYLLCSDGLWGQVSPEDIKSAMVENNADLVCERLVRKALKAGAPDNISAIAFRVDSTSKKATAPFSFRGLFRKH